VTEQTKAEKVRDLRRGYLRLFLRLGLLAAAGYLLLSFVWLLWRVQGQEMVPAVHDGDLLMAARLEKDLHRGDLVIYQAAGRRRVGRIAAHEGDRVEITGDGILRVNGALQNRDGACEAGTEEGTLSLAVPDGSLYILADAPGARGDSREFGPVPIEDVEGKVTGLLRIRGF
jgi:signal peptidase I